MVCGFVICITLLTTYQKFSKHDTIPLITLLSKYQQFFPYFRSKPVKWQEARPENDVSDGKSKKKK